MPEVNPNAAFQNNVVPEAPTTSPAQQTTAPGLLPGSMSTVAATTPQNSIGPGNVPSYAQSPTIGSVAGSVPTPQAQQTPQTPTVSQIMGSINPAQFGSQGTTPSSQISQIGASYSTLAAANVGNQAPATNPMQTPEVQSQLQGGTQQTTAQQQYFDAYSGMSPVTQSLYNNITQMMSTQQTQASLAQEYATLAGPGSTLNADQLQLMNINTVMNGTHDDVAAEITAAGGTATQSQVMAVTAARNTVIMKQASFLQNQLSIQQGYVTNIMQFAQADQSQVNNEINQQTGLLGTMSTLQQTMMQNQIDMANNIVKNGGGYTTLANSLTAADPSGSQLQYYSQLLGADLSSPAWLQQADEYNASKISLEQAKATQAIYNYQLSGGTANLGASGGSVPTIDPTTNTVSTPLAQAMIAQESNGTSTVVSPSGALGTYQIMPSHLPDIGIPNTPAGQQTFLNSPALQTQLYNQIMTQLNAQYGGNQAEILAAYYGGAGAAAVVGTPAGNQPQANGMPSINQYVQQVQAKMSGTQSPPALAVGTTGSPAINSTAPGYTTKAIVGGMTQSAIDQAAITYLTSGTLPTGARSATGAGLAISDAVKNRAGEINSTGNIAANKAQLASLSSSLTTQTTYLNTTTRALTSADNSFNQILTQFQNSGINDQSMPIANILENQAKYGLGTSQMSAFKASLADLSTEYQQVFSRGGGQVTDAVRATSQDIIDGNISLTNLKQVNEQLQKQGAIAVASAQQQVNSINGQISSLATGGAQGISKGSLSSNDFVNQVLSANNVSYQNALNTISPGNIGAIDNSTGQLVQMLPSDFDPSQYTEL